MGARAWWLLLGALAAAAFVYSRTTKGSQAIGAALDPVFASVEKVTAVVAEKLARGLRNNNPGNIRKSASTQWTGERIGGDADPAFEVFTEMKYGVRAAAVLFRNYQRLYGLDTVRQLIMRWAPPNENDTAAYIAAVTSRMNTDPDSYQDLSDRATLEALLRAVFRQENGIAADTIPDSVMTEGIALA